MEVRHGYKQTDIGAIPEDWKIRTIGESMKLINGRAFKPSDWKDQGIPIIRIQNLNDPESPFNYYSGTVEERHRVRSGDILFAWSGTTGTSFGARVWAGPDGILNQHIFRVLADNRYLAPHYSYLILLRVQEDIEKEAHGFKASFVHVKKSDLTGVLLPVPPLVEQASISNALRDVNGFIQSLEQLLVKKRRVKQGAMQELLTGKKRLPGFSENWEEKRLGEIVDTDPENLGSETRSDYRFKYISLEDVDTGTLRSHSEQVFRKAPSRARRKLRRNDVLVSTVRPNLKSHLLFLDDSPDWVCSTGFSVLRCKAGVSNAGYIYFHMFADTITRQIEALLTGSNYPAINSRDVRALKLPVPNYEEQAAIATVLSDISAEISAIESKIVKASSIRQGMMQELLTGRIRLV
jgi:type I restriction enzyme S subunit